MSRLRLGHNLRASGPTSQLVPSHRSHAKSHPLFSRSCMPALSLGSQSANEKVTRAHGMRTGRRDCASHSRCECTKADLGYIFVVTFDTVQIVDWPVLEFINTLALSHGKGVRVQSCWSPVPPANPAKFPALSATRLEQASIEPGEKNTLHHHYIIITHTGHTSPAS